MGHKVKWGVYPKVPPEGTLEKRVGNKSLGGPGGHHNAVEWDIKSTRGAMAFQ